MSNKKVADGPTPPSGTSAKKRVDVMGIGGVDDASNEAASKTDAQVDLTDIGGTGVEDVEPQSVEDLPAADPNSDDAGYNDDFVTKDSGPTATFGDSDGTEKAFTDPVTSVPFPSSDDGKKAARAYYAAVRAAQDAYAVARTSYDNGTLTQTEQQGNNPASTRKHVKGVQPVDPVGAAERRVNPAEPATDTSNNSGPTKTWSGTGGNGVLRQQDPVTSDPQRSDGVAVPSFNKSHTGSVRISSIKLAELEIQLGLTPADEKFNRIAEIENTDERTVLAQIQSYQKVKTAGLNKLAAHRTASVTKVPSMFGRMTSAPNGFQRIANDLQGTPEPTMTPEVMDSALFS